jgi:hypothetical protein
MFGRIRCGKIVLLSIIGAWVSQNVLKSTPPTAMFHDAFVAYDSVGANAFHPVDTEVDQEKLKRFGFSFVPFYQHSKGAKNKDGSKVFEGDRLGRWFMPGLVQGSAAAPGGSLSGGSTPNLLIAQGALGSRNSVSYISDTFTDTRSNFGYFSVPIEYRKFGLRHNIFLRFGHGFEARLRAGVVYYEQTPSLLDQTTNAAGDFSALDIQSTVTTMMTGPARALLFNEIGLNVDRDHHTAFEDTHIEVSWHRSFGLTDEDNEHTVSVMPCIAVGGWLPTGRKQDQDRAMSLGTGNGFYGVTVDGALNFAFPGTIHLGLGGAVAYFESKRETNKRMPSSDMQSTLYPWKVTVRRRLGTTWNVHLGMYAPRFLDKLSAYVNYIYTCHERDSIRMADTDARNALFKPAKFERESSFHSQSLHGGLKYEIATELSIGLAVNFHLTGRKMYRTTTILGDLEFKF